MRSHDADVQCAADKLGPMLLMLSHNQAAAGVGVALIVRGEYLVEECRRTAVRAAQAERIDAPMAEIDAAAPDREQWERAPVCFLSHSRCAQHNLLVRRMCGQRGDGGTFQAPD